MTVEKSIAQIPRSFTNQIQVGNVLGAASVGAREGRPFAQRRYKIVVNALTQTLDIGGMDEKFGAVLRQAVERLAIDFEVRDALPAVDGLREKKVL